MSAPNFEIKPVTRMPETRKRQGRRPKASGKVIEQYEHRGAERVNNPPVGLVSPELRACFLNKIKLE
jgi:hypothetical protein